MPGSFFTRKSSSYLNKWKTDFNLQINNHKLFWGWLIFNKKFVFSHPTFKWKNRFGAKSILLNFSAAAWNEIYCFLKKIVDWDKLFSFLPFKTFSHSDCWNNRRKESQDFISGVVLWQCKILARKKFRNFPCRKLLARKNLNFWPEEFSPRTKLTRLIPKNCVLWKNCGGLA